MIPKAIIPPAITTHVATVRHNVSCLVKFQIARMHAMTLMIMHIVIVTNEIILTFSGFTKPRGLSFGIGGGFCLTSFMFLSFHRTIGFTGRRKRQLPAVQCDPWFGGSPVLSEFQKQWPPKGWQRD